jgi:methyl-accepting chemotaxis protein
VSNIHSISFRIALVVVLAIGALGVTGLFAYTNLRSALFEQKGFELHHEVETVMNIIGGFRERAVKGEMTEEAAKAAAIAAVRPVRFGEDKNYFLILEPQGVAVLFPGKPELEGKNVIDLKDPAGRFIVKELIEKATAGGGLTTYEWLKPGDQAASVKLSYSMLVPGWNWTVGTGFHVHDIEASLARSSQAMIVNTLTALLVIGAVALFVTRSISKPLGSLTLSMDQLRSGDLDIEINGATKSA